MVTEELVRRVSSGPSGMIQQMLEGEFSKDSSARRAGRLSEPPVRPDGPSDADVLDQDGSGVRRSHRAFSSARLRSRPDLWNG